MTIDSGREGRGAPLLLAHCAVLGRVTGDPHRADAYERLEAEVGVELARRLVDALKGGRPAPSTRPSTPKLEVA